jgi:preprotein translocase subunit SecY
VSEPRPIRPVALGERVLTTVVVAVVAVLSDWIPLPYVDTYALARSGSRISPLALGVAPFVSAYALVELVALVIPRIRRWRHSEQGRSRLNLWSGVLAGGLAVMQAFGVAQSLQAAEVVTAPGWEPIAVLTATLAGGTFAVAVIARWGTQRGLVNGFVLWWTIPVVTSLVRGDLFRDVAKIGGARDAALLAAALVVAVAATVVALAGGEAVPSAARIDGVAYRDEKTAAPRPWFPIPLSSLQPLTVASSVLAFPALLVPFHVPGMQSLKDSIERSTVGFEVAYVALVVAVMLAAVALLYRPAEVAAFMRRLGTVSDETARADAVSALRRALLPTMVYVLALVALGVAAGSHFRSAPPMALLAVSTGVVLDLLRSVRAHAQARDLVCVAAVHDAYAVAALRAALGAEGIDARPRGMGVLSLLQAFGAYAPAELYVRAGDAQRASALLRHWAAGRRSRSHPARSPRAVAACAFRGRRACARR